MKFGTRLGIKNRGKDSRINNANALNKAVVQVTKQLTSLETFRWCSAVTHIPADALKALKKAERLAVFHTTFESQRGNVHALSFWDLAPSLVELSIDTLDVEERRDDSKMIRRRYRDYEEDDDENEDAKVFADMDRSTRQAMTGELDDSMTAVFLDSFLQALSPSEMKSFRSTRVNDRLLKSMPASQTEGRERDLVSFKLPAPPFPSNEEALNALHHSIACRTIVAAATGGNLRHLYIASKTIWQPFAVAKLMHCWVNVERWYYDTLPDFDGRPMDRFHKAASTLRTALAHASLWLVPRGDRLLTPQDLQGWFAAFKEKEVAALTARFPELELHNSPIEFYMHWIQENDEVAVLVSDAWNEVVERGEVDVVECRCEECNARWS